MNLRPTKVVGAVLLAGLALFAWIMISRETYRKASEASSHRRLMEIGLALHWYETSEKAFPPAYIHDKKGKPGLSWRVALLPMIGEGELYQKFNLDEPWDSPTNLPLVEQMPDVYRSEFCASSDPGMCTFVVLTDEGTAFPVPTGMNAVGFKQLEDGATTTLLAIELPEAPQVWTKPDLVTPAQAAEVLKRRSKGALLMLGFLDGSVRKYRGYVGDEIFKAISTRAGHETVDLDKIPGLEDR